MSETPNWYAEIYATEDNGGNPFARSTTLRKGDLHDYLMLGGSILDFPRKPSGNVADMVDRALSIPGACR
jgi:hypothetical protein